MLGIRVLRTHNCWELVQLKTEFSHFNDSWKNVHERSWTWLYVSSIGDVFLHAHLIVYQIKWLLYELNLSCSVWTILIAFAVIEKCPVVSVIDPECSYIERRSFCVIVTLAAVGFIFFKNILYQAIHCADQLWMSSAFVLFVFQLNQVVQVHVKLRWNIDSTYAEFIPFCLRTDEVVQKLLSELENIW